MKNRMVGGDDSMEELKRWVSNARKVVIVGIGSPIRRDDFVGVELVRKLQGKVSSSIRLIECEMSPENFLEPIVQFKPTHILLINATQLNSNPGSSRLVELSRIAGPAVLTHALTYHMFREFLGKATGAKVALLAIQPKDTSFEQGLTTELKEVVERLSGFLLRILP